MRGILYLRRRVVRFVLLLTALVILVFLAWSSVMPGMSGPDATAAIRALGVTCPIIGVTGNTLDMDVKRFRDMGANEVRPHPI